jgi:hypothetical protein
MTSGRILFLPLNNVELFKGVCDGTVAVVWTVGVMDAVELTGAFVVVDSFETSVCLPSSCRSLVAEGCGVGCELGWELGFEPEIEVGDAEAEASPRLSG